MQGRNTLLRADLGAPLAVGFVGFLVATATMLLAIPIIQTAVNAPTLRIEGLAGTPACGWLGGVMGAIYVTNVFSAIPSIVAANASLMVAGQKAAPLLIDRFGLRGFLRWE